MIKLAIIDFDGTLLLRDTLPLLMKLWKKYKYPLIKLCSLSASIGFLYIRYKLGLYKMSREKIKMTAMQKFNRLFSGMTKEQVNMFFKRCYKDIIPYLNEAVVEEVKKAKAEGYHTVLLSGCYEQMLEYVAGVVGIDMVIGTKMQFKNGLVDINKPMDIISGSAKVTKIQEVFNNKDVDWEASRAYADSSSDIGLMEMVGHPIAVNPDPELREIAQEAKWCILD